MQTQLTEQFLNTPQGQEANEILRTCVHCGFCTATCPTYQLLGDELDGPRGRIYLIKQLLEGKSISRKTQLHLDRCLTCRSCETTCPSGVQYGRLIDIGRELVEQQTTRPVLTNLKRYALRKILPYPQRVSALLTVASMVSPALPQHLKAKIPEKTLANSKGSGTVPGDSGVEHTRKMLIVEGCVQSVTTPDTNRCAKSLMQKLGIDLFSVPTAGCCGAVSQHLSAHDEAQQFIRQNIDAWWPYIESQNPVEGIIITASGCGAQIKDYAQLMKHDRDYAHKAVRISELAKDICEIIAQENIPQSRVNVNERLIAFHSPCTLQHAQKLDGVVEAILRKLGFNLASVNDAHLCCGSAGTYSILQAELSQKLLENKLENLQKSSPQLIVTANVGCQMHLQSQSDVPVKHWIELLDELVK